MQAYFWGARGSLPASTKADQIRGKMVAALQAARGQTFASMEALESFVDRDLPFAVRGAYGGNTACVEIKGGDSYVLCDAGTGLRDFGQSLAPFDKPAVFHLFISHLHWDHIQGFPFFTPAFVPGNRIHIYGGHADLEQAFRQQQQPPFFPVPFQAMGAEISFTVLETGKPYTIAGLTVQCIRQNHPGDSYGYAFGRNGKKVVYSTDSEHKREADSPSYPYLDFIHGADLLVFDAQYTLLDAMGVKENWGHSSNIVAVELALAGQVKRLCLFHNEHTYDDTKLDHFLTDTRAFANLQDAAGPLEIFLAYDGLSIPV
jgi:phosphoribosyl 1,2-cyclic phosphodiesterase